MKKTEEELDKLHNETMKNLYEVFEDEFDSYFKFREAALDVMEYGSGHFPFSHPYDCAITHIDKSLDIIEKNIVDHINDQLKILFEEKSPINSYVNIESEQMREDFSKKIRITVRQILEARYPEEKT